MITENLIFLLSSSEEYWAMNESLTQSIIEIIRMKLFNQIFWQNL